MCLSANANGYPYLTFISSLNPCYSGCASRLGIYVLLKLADLSLNPCYSGCASRLALIRDEYATVLSLNPCYSGCASRLLNKNTDRVLTILS